MKKSLIFFSTILLGITLVNAQKTIGTIKKTNQKTTTVKTPANNTNNGPTLKGLENRLDLLEKNIISIKDDMFFSKQDMNNQLNSKDNLSPQASYTDDIRFVGVDAFGKIVYYAPSNLQSILKRLDDLEQLTKNIKDLKNRGYDMDYNKVNQLENTLRDRNRQIDDQARDINNLKSQISNLENKLRNLESRVK